jgi:hypothetical protein
LQQHTVDILEKWQYPVFGEQFPYLTADLTIMEFKDRVLVPEMIGKMSDTYECGISNVLEAHIHETLFIEEAEGFVGDMLFCRLHVLQHAASCDGEIKPI